MPRLPQPAPLLRLGRPLEATAAVLRAALGADLGLVRVRVRVRVRGIRGRPGLRLRLRLRLKVRVSTRR